MPSTPHRLHALALLPVLLVASACDKRVSIEMPKPPVADIEAVTAPKPKPVGDIVNDDKAAARHSEALESWGEGLSAAGVRLCRWFHDAGVPVVCPEPK